MQGTTADRTQTTPVEAPTRSPLSVRGKYRKDCGALLEKLTEEEIVDLIILHRLTPEVYKISRLLNQALR